MAFIDAHLSSVLYFVLLPAVILYVLVRYVLGLTKPKTEAILFNLVGGWMHRKFFNREKRLLFEQMNDLNKKKGGGLSILEIGVGSGMNFDFYPEGSQVTALDPNPHHEVYVRANVEKTGGHVRLVKFVNGFAENMSGIASDSFDAVVCTLTLCSVKDPTAVLAEVKRVLKPGGTFFFLEHVAGEHGSFVRRIQDIIQYICPHFTKHRHINRETWRFLDQSGFRDIQYRHYTINTWIIFFAKPCLYGTAVK